MERLHGALGFVFLEKGKDGIDDDDPEDGPSQRGHALAGFHEVGGEREAGSDPEQQGEKMGEVADESTQDDVPVRFREPVGAELHQPLPRLFRGKTAAGGFQAFQRRVGREGSDIVVPELKHARLAR